MWFGNEETIKLLRDIQATIAVLREENRESQIKWARGKLPSISKNNVQYVKKMSPTARKNHVADASIIFENFVFKKEHDALIDTQVYFMAEESAQDDVSLSFGRGTINGIRLMYERFESMAMEHKSNIEPKKEPDPTDYRSFTEDDL